MEAVAPDGLARRAVHVRPHHRDRHRGRHYGGGAGPGRDGDSERGARAGGRRSGRSADEDGRADRRRGHLHHPDSRACERLHGAEHSIIADRIEAGTFLIAGAITGGDLVVTDCEPEHLMRADLQDAPGGRGGFRRRAARAACPQWRRAEIGGRDHGRISGLRHRSAGAVHGADDAGAGHFARHRNHFREPLHACAGVDAHGREHPARGPAGHRRRPESAHRRVGDRLGFARQRVAGSGGARRRAARPSSTASTTSTAATRRSKRNWRAWARISSESNRGQRPMAKQHNPGFLALVNDAKTRVKQIDIQEFRRMCENRRTLRADRRARRQRMGRRSCRRRGASRQGHHRARHRNAVFPTTTRQAGALLRRRLPFGAGRATTC